MTKQQVVSLDGRRLTLTNLDKLLWPEDAINKAEFIHYCVAIYPIIRKHLYQRPLVVTRYPDGINGESFYQKNIPDYAPEWIQTCPIYSEESARTINFILVNDLPTLCWLANQACIELHPWMSRPNKLEYPDFAVIDLDPSEGATYQDACEVALVLKTVLDELGLVSYPKTSGATGLHIYLPVRPEYTYEEIRWLTQRIAEIVVELIPEKATIVRQVKKRAGRVYVDYLQNIRGKTLCAPYSVRPLDHAPVSTPLQWHEVPGSDPKNFTIRTIMPRLQEVGDLFAPVIETSQSLETAFSRLGYRQIPQSSRPARMQSSPPDNIPDIQNI